MRRLGGTAFLVAALAVVGCGGGKSANSKDPGLPPLPKAKAPAAAPSDPGLLKPVYAKCGVGIFNKPTSRARVYGGRTSWNVYYLLPQGAPKILGQTSAVTLYEQSPKGKRGNVQGGHDVKLGGRSVSFRAATPKTPSNVLQWKTHTARYLMLADGGPRSIAKIVRCLP